MKSVSVSMIKYRRKGCPQRMVPKDGTRLRAIYDALMDHKGEVVDIKDLLPITHHGRSQCLNQLRQNYELDIRMVRHFHYRLVGEWDGLVYLDYLEEKSNAGND